MKKKLLLVNNYFGFFPCECNSAIICDLYKPVISSTRLFRAIRKIHLKSFFGGKSIWFDSWKNKVSNFDTIVIFDNGNIDSVVEWIYKKNRNVKIIVWYWGPVDICFNPSKLNRKHCDIWSFDCEDCKKYDFKHNTQLFFKENIANLTLNSIKGCKYDVAFIGTEKNRLAILTNLEKKMNCLGIKTYFHIVKSKKHYKNDITNFPYKKPIDYSEMLEIINSSKAVLDIVSEDQTGMTLRPLEALFLKRKLITNDKNITSFDIFNPNNIFILGQNSIKELNGFLNSDYDETNYDYLINKYSADAWISRFN